MKTRRAFAGFLAIAGFPLLVDAAVFVDTTPGTGAPPASLGGYAMGAFPLDATPEGTMISALAPPVGAPVTGNLQFQRDVEHFRAGGVWDTWSHGYTGDVYFESGSEHTLTLPAGTLAFYLYIQPNLKSVYDFVASSGAASVLLAISGDSGAHYAGFYTDDALDPLTMISVRELSGVSDGFAMGEFGINVHASPPVPEPGSLALLGLGLAGLGLSRRRKAA